MGIVFSYGYSVVFSPFRARLTDCVSRGILKLHVEMLSVNTVRLLLPTYLQFASSASTVCKEPTWQASCRICLTFKKSCIKETYMHFTFAPFAYSWTMDTLFENHSKMLILLCHCSKYVRDMRPELRGLLLLKIVYPIFYISAEISRKFLDRWTYDDSFPLFIAGKPN